MDWWLAVLLVSVVCAVLLVRLMTPLRSLLADRDLSDLYRENADRNDAARDKWLASTMPCVTCNATGRVDRPSDRVPAEVFPPGDYINEEREARGLTHEELMDRLGWDGYTYYSVKVGRTAIDESLAGDLSRVFGTSVESWLNMEQVWQGGRGGRNDNAAV